MSETAVCSLRQQQSSHQQITNSYHLLPGLRRHTPYPHMASPEFRIFEINKRLQQRTEVSLAPDACDCMCVFLRSQSHILYSLSVLLQESDNLWWDSFATEFFEDDATLTLTFCLEDGPKRYSKSISSSCR